MKRLFIHIGIALTVATLSLPKGAPAAEAAPFAVSPAVAGILDRAEKGLAEAETSGVIGLFLDSDNASWSRYRLTPVSQRLNQRTQVIQRERSNMARTTCFHTDLMLMEEMLERVRAKMNEGFTQKRFVKIMELADLYSFLSERYEYLVRGGLNPHVWDRTGNAQQSFDDPNATFAQGPICFYHSDYTSPGYLLPTRDGYGCDAQTLQSIKDALPQNPLFETLIQEVNRELNSLTTIQGAADAYIANLQSVEQSAAGNTNPPAPRTHLVEYGCVTAPQPGVVLEPLRGNFSIEPDDLRLMLSFRTLRVEQEANRPVPFRLRDALGEGLLNGMRDVFRGRVRQFSDNQARRQSATVAVSTDTLLSIRRSLRSLGDGVGRLAKLAVTIDEQPGQERGLRSFVRDYAFFLYRSCVAYSCAARLERIARIALTRECFPYTNGEYLDDDPNTPRWQKCMEEAL